MTMTAEINTIDDLKSLLQYSFPRQKLCINLKHGKTVYEDKMNQYIEECGCKLGSYFLSISLVISLVLVFILKLPIWKEIISLLALCIVIALLGKFIGLAIARIKFYQQVRKYISELEILEISPGSNHL